MDSKLRELGIEYFAAYDACQKYTVGPLEFERYDRADAALRTALLEGVRPDSGAAERDVQLPSGVTSPSGLCESEVLVPREVYEHMMSIVLEVGIQVRSACPTWQFVKALYESSDPRLREEVDKTVTLLLAQKPIVVDPK